MAHRGSKGQRVKTAQPVRRASRVRKGFKGYLDHKAKQVRKVLKAHRGQQERIRLSQVRRGFKDLPVTPDQPGRMERPVSKAKLAHKVFKVFKGQRGRMVHPARQGLKASRGR